MTAAKRPVLTISWEIPLTPLQEPLCWWLMLRMPIWGLIGMLALLTVGTALMEGMLGVCTLWTPMLLRWLILLLGLLCALCALVLWEAGSVRCAYAVRCAGVRLQVWVQPRHGWGRWLVRTGWPRKKRKSEGKGHLLLDRRMAWKHVSRVLARPEEEVVLLCKPVWHMVLAVYCTKPVYRTLEQWIRERFVAE